MDAEHGEHTKHENHGKQQNHWKDTFLAVTNLAIEEQTPVRAKEAYGMYERVCAENGADPLSPLRPRPPDRPGDARLPGAVRP
ncbi:hypothetical protein J2752_000559 [Halarchaeum rubridurum]|uniref:Uncharacterized protein n=1 Tax=Halarchaeum rubridurum TaxID=489911 RepID=A0A8T4GK72_9EURY|nr:hypothetical protein [Halarchaeum rubridurum]MBP1953678.1 hypothetical protein [Halarchaeum rubridurum]